MTNEKGNYSFFAVDPGTYFAAVAEGCILVPHVEVKVNAGDIGIANFIIKPAPSLKLGSISGTAKDSNGPLFSVLVTLIDNTTSQIVAVTTTIDDGEYTFYDLINNEYSVLFVNRYYPYRVNNVIISDMKKLLTVDALVKANIDVRKATISGMFTCDSAGVVEGFVELYIVKEESRVTIEELVAVTKSNAAGQYLFANVDVATYVVKAKKHNCIIQI